MSKPASVESGLPTSTRPLLLVAAAASAGILLDRTAGQPIQSFGWLPWGAIAGLACLGWLFLRKRNHNRASACVLLIAVTALGGAWHHLRWNTIDENHIVRFAGESFEPVCVEAVAVGRVQHQSAPPANPLRAVPVGSRSNLLVQITKIRDGSGWLPATGECHVRIEGNLAGIKRGDRLRVFAQFSRPLTALNPGQFDWAKYERGAGHYADLYCRTTQCISVLETGPMTLLSRWLDNGAFWCKHQLSKYVGEKYSGLAQALTLSDRDQLDRSAAQSFFRTGTVHLLVVSGLHVGLLASAIWLLTRFGLLPQRTGVVVTGLLIVAYAAVTGGRPPVIRATVLVLFALLSFLSGRQASRANLLAAAALVVLAINPSELFRGGTQLSFLCVAAILGYTTHLHKEKAIDPLKRLVFRANPWHRKVTIGIRKRFGELAMVSVVIWLVIAPLVAYHFHIFTPISFVLTPIVWPFAAVALILALAICTVCWVLPPVASLMGNVCSACLGVGQWLIDAGDKLHLHFYSPGPALWWLIGFYGLLFALVIFSRTLPNWKWQVSAIALWISVGTAASAMEPEKDQLRCTFLAMGHGTCVVMELPGDQVLLYDAGSLGSPTFASRTVAAYLWSRGITHIDAVVFSHADIDHYNAMPGLIERFGIGVVYVSPQMFDPWATDGQLTAPNFLRTSLVEAGIPLREIWMNDRLTTNDPKVSIDVLHPPKRGVVGRDNANSLLLNVKFAGISILLPGDLESPGIEAVMDEPSLDCDILLAPHHGSANSDPPGFAAWCTPEWVVVSGRDHDHHGSLTAASYRAIGAQVLHTADCGAAQFVISDQFLQTSTFR